LNKPFRKRFDTVRLTSEAAARQGRAARLAWEHMPEPGAAVAFLNTHDEALGGRPIDLAVASAAGLLAVEEALVARTRPTGEA
jgi:hypothetical protein